MADMAQIAADALEQRACDLFAERRALRRRMLQDAARDLEIERDINGCLAGAAALGFRIEIEGYPPPFILPGHPKNEAHKLYIQARNNLAHALPALGVEYGIGDETEDEPAEAATPEMPRIADVVLDRLGAAGESGEKAAAIRQYILRTYSADIHEKTVGMTLYRLQKEGKVRRDGHTWFLAEARNPGLLPGSFSGSK